MNQLLAMRAFVRVVETGSFSRAADHLDLPRSTVSKLLADLERHLNVRLIHRTTRAVRPTADGLEYFEHASRLISELDAVDRALRGDTLKPSGHLRIDAPSSFATTLLIPALADFHREYPDITVAVGVSDRTLNLVGEGVDCAIRGGELGDVGLIARRIADLPYVTCATPAYLRRHGVPETPEDILQHHCTIGYFYASTARPEGFVLQQGEVRHVVERAAFTTNDGNGLSSLILTGLGIGQHLRHALQPFLDTGELQEVLPAWTRPPLPMHLVYPPHRHQSPRLVAFIEWLMRRFGDAPSGKVQRSGTLVS